MLALPVLLIRGWKLVKQQTLGAAHRDPGIPCSAHTGFAGVLGRSWNSHKASLCSEAAAITITGWKDQSQDMSLARSLSYLSQGCSLRIPWGTMIVGHPAWHLVNGEPLCWRQHFYRSLFWWWFTEETLLGVCPCYEFSVLPRPELGLWVACAWSWWTTGLSHWDITLNWNGTLNFLLFITVFF